MKPNTVIIKQLQNIKGIYFDKDKKAWRLPNKESNIQIHPVGYLTNGVNPKSIYSKDKLEVLIAKEVFKYFLEKP